MASLLTGLALYYNMQGNADDVSGNGNSGTATDVTFSTANGKIQQGGGFNGSSSNIIKTNSTLATGVVARTIACWGKPSVNNNNYPVAFATSTVKDGGIESSQLAFYMAPSTNRIGLGTWGPTPDIEGSSSILDNNWHFFVGTSDGTTIMLYVDNVFQGSKTQTISFFNKNVNVGCLSEGTQSLWTGQVDECGVWNRVLTQNEITTLWNGGQGMTYPFVQPAMFLSFLCSPRPSSLLSGLALYYNMEGNATDVSGNGNSGTATNVTFSTANGKIQQGGGFNGSSSTIIKTNSTLATGVVARTIACWVRRATITGGSFEVALATSDAVGGTNSLAFFMFPNSGILNLGTNGTDLLGSVNIADNAWHFCVGTTNGTTIQFYVDNVSQGTLSAAVNFANSTVSVGNYRAGTANATYWTGQIDECGVWNRVLTADEITTLWNNGQGRTYPFD